MKTLRIVGILVAVALVALGVALLPSADEMPQARPGIAVGEPAPSDAGRAGAEPSGEAVALPSVTEQPVRGTDSDVGAMEPEASSAPPATQTPAQPPSSSDSGPGSSSDSSGNSSSGGGRSSPPRPSGVCEWDDGELDCDDDYDGASNVVDVYVGYLRGKLGASRLVTVRGAGYKLIDPTA